MELTGKLALITGSTGGIGSESARLMAAAGAEVVVSGRDADAARRPCARSSRAAAPRGSWPPI
jgi:NAD(P)-dependent dehydrogenase (short-subunit alcohol dehydrogenase family)